jgi:hypothetical protein
MSRPSEPVDTTGQVVGDLRLAHLHDGTLAELLFDLRQRCGKGFAFLVVHGGVERHFSDLREYRPAAGRPGRQAILQAGMIA